MKFNHYIGPITACVGLGLLVSGTSAFAGGVEAAPVAQPFGSFYVGGGVDLTTLHYTDKFLSQAFNPSLSNIFESKSYSSGGAQYMGNMVVGFQTRSWHKLNLALEGYVALAPRLFGGANTTYSNNAFSGNFSLASSGEEFQITPTYGFGLMPGYQIEPNLTLFGRIGYTWAKLFWHENSSLTFYEDASSTNTLGLTSPLNTYDLARRPYLHGIQAGLGFRMRASKHIVYSTGYYWNQYNTSRFNFTTFDSTDPTRILSQNFFYKRRSQEETFTQSILYYFTPTEAFKLGTKPGSGMEVYMGIDALRDLSATGEADQSANPCVAPRCSRFVTPQEAYAVFKNASQTLLLGWAYEAFLGAGYTLPNALYLGTELFFDGGTSSHETKSTQTIPPGVAAAAAGSTSAERFVYRMKDAWGLGFLPGYRLDNRMLVYSKLGFVTRDFNLSRSFISSIPNARSSFLYNYKDGRSLIGYQVGLGFDVRLFDNLFLRNEYTLTTYANKKFPRRAACCSASGAGFLVAEDYTYSNFSSQYKLGLVYRLPV